MSLRSQIITLDITIFIGGKLNKRLLAFLLLSSAILPHYAYGATCSARTTSAQCYNNNNSMNGYCYWTYTGMGQDFMCSECPNVPLQATGVSGNVYSDQVGSLDVDYTTACPMAYRCQTPGYAIHADIVDSNGVLVSGGETYSPKCVQCQDNTFAESGERLVILSRKLTTGTITKTEEFAFKTGERFSSADSLSISAYPACQECGEHSYANENNSNCICEEHYASPTNRISTENVGAGGCVEKDYHIRFNLGYTTQDEYPYIIYRRPSHVYLDPTNDNANLENAATLDHIVKVIRPKYVFGGWYTDLNKVFSSQNIIQKRLSYNPVSNSNTIENGYIIYLTAKWNKGTYKIIYENETFKTCTYTQSCIVDRTGESLCTDETSYFTHWTNGAGKTIEPGADFLDFEHENAEFNSDTELYLSAYCGACPEYKHCTGGKMYDCDEGKWCHDGIMEECPENHFCVDGKKEKCPAGYWCSNGEKNPCPAGKTSAGATYEFQCFYGGGTSGTKFCDSTGGCFNLPSGVKISEK